MKKKLLFIFLIAGVCAFFTSFIPVEKMCLHGDGDYTVWSCFTVEWGAPFRVWGYPNSPQVLGLLNYPFYLVVVVIFVGIFNLIKKYILLRIIYFFVIAIIISVTIYVTFPQFFGLLSRIISYIIDSINRRMCIINC